MPLEAHRPWLGAALVLAACTQTSGGSREAPRPPPAAERPPLAAPDSKPAPRAEPDASPDAAAPRPPPYDLVADVARITAEATEELGAKTEVHTVEDVFVLIRPPSLSKGAFAGTKVIVKKALAAYFNGRFAKRPARAVAVYLFPSQRPYDRWCTAKWSSPCDSSYGFYLARERKIVMNVGPGVGTLTHELVHPIVETDFPEAPDWINEGIASLFERFSFPKRGAIAGYKNWRHPRLVQALWSKREKDYARLETLFGMSDEVFRGEHEDLHYAMARYFCQWMDQKGWLWPFYQRWRDSYQSDPTGEKAFVETVGKTPAEAHAGWAR